MFDINKIPFTSRPRAKRVSPGSGSNNTATAASHAANDAIAEIVWENIVNQKGFSAMVINALLTRSYESGLNPMACKYDLYLYQFAEGITIGDPHSPIDANVIPMGIIRFEGTTSDRVLTDGSGIDRQYIQPTDFTPLTINTHSTSTNIYGVVVAVDAIILPEVEDIDIDLSLAY